MKRPLLTIIAASLAVLCASAFPKAIYVKQGDTYTKYNFGVAGDLKFSNQGHTLTITGYSEAINLDKIDYITFTAPVDNLALTPAAQKDKMITIGQNIDDQIDINRYAGVINMFYAFHTSYWDDADRDWHRAPSEFYLDPKYYDLFRDTKAVMAAADQLVHGNAAGARILKAKAVNLYKASDYFGVYTADYKNEAWVKTADANYLEIRFEGFKQQGEGFSLRLETSSDYTTWNTADANVQMPKTMTLTFKQGSKVIASSTIATSLVQDKSIDMTIDFTCNDLVAHNELKVVNNGLDDKATVKIAGKDFAKCDTHIDGQNLVNYDSWKSAADATQHTHDEYGNCNDDEDWHPLIAHFIRANTVADVMGQLQVKGKAFGITKMYDTLSAEDSVETEYTDNDGYSTWTYGQVIENNKGDIVFTSDVLNYYNRVANHLNNYTDASFYYDGTNQLQGYLTWEVTEDEDEYWFNDDSRYAIVGNNLLVQLRHEDLYLYENGYPEYIGQSDYWGYEMYRFDQQTYESQSKFVRVADNKVIKPNTVTERWYEVTPILTFPDLSNYAFQDYFTETSFQKLVDDLQDLVDTYMTITGQD